MVLVDLGGPLLPGLVLQPTAGVDDYLDAFDTFHDFLSEPEAFGQC